MSAPADDDAPLGDRALTRTQQVSNRMANLYKSQFGRGPRSVRTHFAGADLVITVLEGSMTPAELRLREMGQQQHLRETRLAYQYGAEGEFRRIIEEATGRRVRAFTSAHDVDADVAIEGFALGARITAADEPG